MAGRQHRQPSRISGERATDFLEKVHSDIAGPFPYDRQGNRYYQSFYDEATSLMDIYLMKHKSESLKNLKDYVALRENQSGKRLKLIQSDGAFPDWNDYCTERGIVHKTSPAYTPDQNGKAERFNRTILGPVRSVLYTKKLAKSCWSDIAKAVVYILNRSPLGQDSKSAYERLKDQKPYIGHLKVLGCRTWVHIPKEKRTKLDERSWQGIHVGYEATNQFRILDPRTGKVHCTRDVQFDEKNVYDRKGLRPVDVDDEEWAEDDDKDFADADDYINDSSDDDVPPPRRIGFKSNRKDYITPPATLSPENSDESDDDTILGGLETVEFARPSEAHRFARNQGGNNESPSEAESDPAGVLPLQNVDTRRRSKRSNAGQSSKSMDTYYPDIGERSYPKLNKEGDHVRTSKPKPASGPVTNSHKHMVTVLAMLSAGVGDADTDEPLTLKQAQASPHWPEFQNAMRTELNSHIENGTWELVPTPEDAKVLTGRWVFKIKKDRYGKILKFKARWVVHGYKQEEGSDYEETFACVVKPMSWKAMMGVAAKRGYCAHQMDVVTAFLYGFLDETIYVYQPTSLEDDTRRVCRLRKALYGLKQSPRVWYKTLQDFLAKLGFKRTEADHGCFISSDKSIFIAVYVDDLLIFGAPDDPRVEQVMQHLRDRFQMTDLGKVSHYLGMEVDIDVKNKRITLRQSTYLRKIVAKYGLANCKPARLPMSPGVPNSLDPFDGQADKKTVKWFQSAIGALMWPAVHSRPDLAQAVGVLSRYCSNPGPTHVALVKQVLRYISGTLNRGLVFDGSTDTPNDIIGYTDSDFAGTKSGRKSTGGYVFLLAGAAISHSSKLQSIVALSTCEAEYIAMCEAGKEAIWIYRLLVELGYQKKNSAILLRADNQGAIALASNPEFHRRTKHIDVRYHWIREAVEQRQIEVVYVPTSEMAADGLTKPLPLQGFEGFLQMIGMADITSGEKTDR